MFFSMWDGVYVKKLTTTSTILVNTRSVKRKLREMCSGRARTRAHWSGLFLVFS